MAKSKKKNYYAVVHGACDPAPGIFSSWALTHALTSGVSCPVFKGFGQIEEARAYMAQNGVTTYSEIIDLSQNEGETSTSERFFHVVVHGRNIGVHSRYYHGAEEEVSKYSHACHQRCSTVTEAIELMRIWNETWARRKQV